MTPRSHSTTSPWTWDRYKRKVRRVDRDSLLVQAAATAARIAQDEVSDELARMGLTPWCIGDVARTALAWSRFERPEADLRTLLELCNRCAQLADEGLVVDPNSAEGLGQVLARHFFEQFPSQRSIFSEIARTILLFGSGVEFPPNFTPEAMTPGWFESITDGLSLDDYVESIFLISTMAQQHNGGFSLNWLDGPGWEELDGVIPLDAVRRTFTEHLVTTASAFKEANRGFQDPLPTAQKKFAFNPLLDTPFIEDVAPIPIAPLVQAIMRKAVPPSIYHLSRRELGDAFTRDLGHVFQHYVGRHLGLVSGDSKVVPELRYGPRRSKTDSCDWFVDLPGALVLVECKASQPVESLRVGSADWLEGVGRSIGKGFAQLNRSNRDIEAIAGREPAIDPRKPRVGIVVTMEPFYADQNWILAESLPARDFPIAVVSAEELESLATLDAVKFSRAVLDNEQVSAANELRLRATLSGERHNELLSSTWESIGLFSRIESFRERAGRAT
ncbi:hypothetical protein KM427_16130 [Nocardioides sp. LMS-CY]|uniref:hypothetical protein n=1 Tax=Nocardioides sp. (strain LMS-CY) TaxID=2840457 RepID=UPI001BFFDA8B|nr:hypothetical protein [Nocardioides sp. LMS-CY]QWF20506.1 hypothetical protein KM427_16130 [Nocardioides sp. LMS-CY]